MDNADARTGAFTTLKVLSCAATPRLVQELRARRHCFSRSHLLDLANGCHLIERCEGAERPLSNSEQLNTRGRNFRCKHPWNLFLDERTKMMLYVRNVRNVRGALFAQQRLRRAILSHASSCKFVAFAHSRPHLAGGCYCQYVGTNKIYLFLLARSLFFCTVGRLRTARWKNWDFNHQ